jgi:FeS assembly protein IscX
MSDLGGSPACNIAAMTSAFSMTELYWDTTFEIAMHLNAAHPDVDFKEVTLQKIYEWTVALPQFADDPALVNDDFLTAIYQEWFEEANPL